MRKRNIVALLAVLVLGVVLPCSISYASSTASTVTSSVYFANNQLKHFLGGVGEYYRSLGFVSPSDMENARVGTPVHLYRFSQTGIENYTTGDLPVVDDQEWMFPVYGGNNQIETVLITNTFNGKPSSVLGGLTPTFLQDFFQEYDNLAKQADSNSLNVILEPNLSTLFFEYKQNGKSLIIPYIWAPNSNYGLQNRTVYDTNLVGQVLKAIQVKWETELENAHKIFPNQPIAGSIIGVSSAPSVSPTSNGYQESLFSLWVLIVLGIVAWVIYLLRRIKLSANKGP